MKKTIPKPESVSLAEACTSVGAGRTEWICSLSADHTVEYRGTQETGQAGSPSNTGKGEWVMFLHLRQVMPVYTTVTNKPECRVGSSKHSFVNYINSEVFSCSDTGPRMLLP